MNLATHYPSWGFETLVHSYNNRSNSVLITPHGDLKPSDVHIIGMFVHELITPHGDLKRVSSSQYGAGCSTHYPSWGFETIKAKRIRNKAIELITPHGDLKLDDQTKKQDAVLLAHYPSWGFETCQPSLVGRWHGKTHYPSWGFETGVAIMTKNHTLNSLPLMGI